MNVERIADRIVAKMTVKPKKLNEQANESATSPLNDLPEPSEAQIESGGYKKGHIVVHGLQIAVENPAGSERKGVDPNGKPWSSKMNHHYGYIKGVVGADKDHLDVFVNPDSQESEKVFVVNQGNDGKFDEHKVMLGFDSAKAAYEAYLSNYDDGWDGAMSVTPMSMEDFKAWAEAGKAKKTPVTNDETVETTKDGSRLARELLFLARELVFS